MFFTFGSTKFATQSTIPPASTTLCAPGARHGGQRTILVRYDGFGIEDTRVCLTGDWLCGTPRSLFRGVVQEGAQIEDPA
jgi:hypothetical protein